MPQKRQRYYYSGKEKRHTLKTQLYIDRSTGQIIYLAFSNGKKHDFKLFKSSNIHVKPDTVMETDIAYVALPKIHVNSVVPKKHSKKHPLTREDKQMNRIISSDRIHVEHTIGFVKRFRILSERYCNSRKRY